MTDAIELRIPARAEHLALVRTVVAAVAQAESHLDAARLDDLRVATTEACANAIEAYARIGTPGEILVRCVANIHQVTVELRDEAGGFDPAALVPHPDVTRPERLHYERGLGIPLMRTLADEADIRSDATGTTVRLVLTDRPRRPELASVPATA